jgi:type I restriction enzyme, S subunit
MPTKVALGNIVRFVGGGTPTRSNSAYYGGDIPWVTPKDMKTWNVLESQVTLTQQGVESSAARVVPENSVLIVVRSGVLKHTLPVGINRRPVAINQDMKALICSDEVVPDYLARYIKAQSAQILGWVRATTADNFPVEKLKQLKIALPSVLEQQIITDKLDYADSLREKRRRVRALLEELTQSLFRELFGDLVANDRDWPMVKVAEFVQDFQSGKNVAPAEEETDLQILKVSAVTSGIFDPTESKPVPLSYSPPKSHFVRHGDLLFSRANTSELVGATALVTTPPPNLLLPDKLWRFVWYYPPRAVPVFVHHLFQQPEFRQKISLGATGSSGSMKNISQAKVLAIACGLPPLDLQQAFARKVGSMEALLRSAGRHQAALDQLSTSLSRQAFHEVS